MVKANQVDVDYILLAHKLCYFENMPIVCLFEHIISQNMFSEGFIIFLP